MNFYREKKRFSKKDFVSFLKDLQKDYIENPNSWENGNIGSFLEAMAFWVEEMDNFYENQNLSLPKNINWEIFADILQAAKIYE